jgi:transcriptional regulator with XRE-family HTH domain
VPDNYAPQNSKNLCGFKIRKAREAHIPLITQDQLAGKFAALGLVLDRTAIAKIERGQRGVYDYELGAIACALDVDIRLLINPTKGLGK